MKNYNLMCPPPDDEPEDSNDGEKTGDVTRWLEKFQNGKTVSKEDFFGLIEEHLRRIAHGKLLKEDHQHSLQTSELMDSVWIKLFKDDTILHKISNSSDLYRLVATATRNLLVSYARRRKAQKRGSKIQRVDIEGVDIAVDPQTSIDLFDDILKLEKAMNLLKEQHPDWAELVELKFYGDHSILTMSQILGLSEATIVRHWRSCRAFLHDAMRGI